MKKLYLQKIVQHGEECYIGKIDPRILVRLAVKVEMSEVQDAQRPLNKKRVTDIAKYVQDDSGILPNTLTIATKDDKYAICQDESNKEFFYIEIPETNEEFNKYKESIEVMDGQHRLYSFLPEIRSIADKDKFEIGFTLYDKPDLFKRRRIFISCNEKQEKVPNNLLLWFKRKLNMISDEEERLLGLVEKLNADNPLKGHIIMSAEKITNGVKAKEVMNEIKNAGVLDLKAGTNALTDDKIVEVLRKYLFAWQKVCGFDFSSSSAKAAGVAVKISGLRFMIGVMPAVWDHCIATKEKFTQEFCEETIKKMISKTGSEVETFFTSKELNHYYRDRTQTAELIKICREHIKKLGSEDFDPLA